MPLSPKERQQRLAALPKSHQFAFAAICAERAVKELERVAPDAPMLPTLRQALELLWKKVLVGKVDFRSEVQAVYLEVDRLHKINTPKTPHIANTCRVVDWAMSIFAGNVTDREPAQA